MQFLVVNFHYIHEENKYPFPGIYPTPPQRFINQLEKIGRYFSFINQEDLILAVEGKKKLPSRRCLITFDDGLKNQYENALPILKRKGIPALFFVNGLPYNEKKVCFVHKIHWAMAHLSPQEFSNKINSNLKLIFKKSLDDFGINENLLKNYYRYDKPGVAKLKFILNNLLRPKEKEIIINEIFKEIVKDEKGFCETFYMSKEEVKNLYKLSLLGIHSYSHNPLSQLSKKQLLNDTKQGLKTIYNIVGGKKIKSISYPYGKPETINNKVINCCRSLGLKLGFTMERAFNTTLNNPLLFARMDTNDVIGGKYPAFNFKDNRIKILRKVTMGRQVFFKEKLEKLF